MIDQKKRTVRFETSSLLPLKLVLIEAERDLPARTPKEHDVDEELALKLIAQMKKLSFDAPAPLALAEQAPRAQSKRSTQQNPPAVKINDTCHGYITLEP
ncbi:MAG: hypothetical protein ABIU06_04240 [Anaerolineales bacterium]